MEVGTVNKIDLQPGNDIRYALMLPLLTNQKDELLPRYTLVYDDWEVLTVANIDVWKGRVRMEPSVLVICSTKPDGIQYVNS